MDRDDFTTLGQSVMEQVLVYVGRHNLLRAIVTGHPASELVDVELVLKDDTWESQSRAIDKMIEVRQMFMDEVDLDYWFSSPASLTGTTADTPFAFAMA